MSTQSQIHILENEAAKRANADPLPGPAGDAFAKNGPIEVGPHVVREVVASDWKVLKALDSPIIKMIMEMRQNPNSNVEIDVTDDEEFQIAFQFTRPPKVVREAMAKGKEAFTETAVLEIGDKIDSPTIKLIQAAVMEQIRRSWITAVSYKEKLEEKGEVRFFQDSGKNPETA